MTSTYPKLKIDELPDFLKPKVRLFLSADLVGSTAFKQKEIFPISKTSESDTLGSLRGAWFTEISRFYKKFPIIFHNKWLETKGLVIEKKSTLDLGEEPSFWKANGDELLYVKELKTPQDLYLAIAVWRDSLKEYRTDLKERGINDLDIKAAAWTAGFPIINSEIILLSNTPLDFNVKFDEHEFKYNDILKYINDPVAGHFILQDIWANNEDKRHKFVKDFIGSQIDTGFRVSTLATPRKFTLSLEATYILLHALNHHLDGVSNIILKYDGRHPLKGVLKNKEYPIFWVDGMENIDDIAEMENKISPNVKTDDATQFFEKFINNNPDILTLPFLFGCQIDGLNSIPNNYEDRVSALNYKWKREKENIIAGITRSEETDQCDQPEDEKAVEDSADKIMDAIRI